MADDNGRVTLAVLSTKLDSVLEKLDDFDVGARDRERRLRDVEQQLGRIAERQTISATLQAVYTTISAAIAGFLGTR